MRTLLLSILLAAARLAAQTTNYPTALDTDATLFVTADNIQTLLAAPMLATDATATVISGTGFEANMIVTVCDAVNSTGVCTAFEEMLVTGVSGNVLAVSRHFAGTTAVAHVGGRAVSVYIDAAHQSSLKAAVIAIETSLGPSLANVAALIPNPLPIANGGTGSSTAAAARAGLGAAASGVNNDITSLTGLSAPLPVNEGGTGVSTAAGIRALVGAVVSSDYNFTAQTPSGVIVPGNNSITMAPVPAGVNGSDVAHQLLVGGTGTPEPCLITGGGGTAGAGSGVIILNCAGSHAAGFTVASATDGLAEAAQATPNGQIWAPVGTLPMFGTLTLSPPATAQRLSCLSWGSVLQAQFATQDIVHLFGANPSFVDGCAFGSAVGKTGGAAIQLGNGTTDNSAGSGMNHLLIGGMFNGVNIASGSDWTLTNSQIAASNYDLWIRNLVNGDQGDDTITGNNFQMFGSSPPPAVVRWESGGGVKFTANKVVATAQVGLDMFCMQAVCTGDLSIVGNSIEGGTTAALRVTTNNASIGRIVIGHNQMGGSTSAAPSITVSGTGGGAVEELIIDSNDLVGGIVLGASTSWATITNNLLNGGSVVTSAAIDTSAAAGLVLAANNLSFGFLGGRYNTGALTTIADFGPPLNPDTPFAKLPAAAEAGSVVPCYGCTLASNPCTTGAGVTLAHRVATVWKCD